MRVRCERMTTSWGMSWRPDGNRAAGSAGPLSFTSPILPRKAGSCKLRRSQKCLTGALGLWLRIDVVLCSTHLLHGLLGAEIRHEQREQDVGQQLGEAADPPGDHLVEDDRLSSS